MTLDVERILSASHPPVSFAWTPDDVIRYHLALGAGSPRCEGEELRYVYEAQLRVLPTFTALAASGAAAAAGAGPGFGHDPTLVLQGAHNLEVRGPVPPAAESVNRPRVTAVYDKGRFAVVDIVVDTEVAGCVLACNSFRLLLLGEGGCSRDPGPHQAVDAPQRPPDATFEVATLPQQAALFRMSGDRAPIHIDPDAARAAGLAAPTLPGLCTWAMVAKAITDRELLARGATLHGFGVRFAGPVYPGETLAVSIWRGTREYAVSATVLERAAPALTHGRLRLVAGGLTATGPGAGPRP